MIVTLLTKVDYAGSGYKIAELLRREGVDAQIIAATTGRGNRKYKIKAAKPINAYGKAAVKKRIGASKIIHFKGDFLYNNTWEGFSLAGKKRIYSFAGTYFRRLREKAVCMAVHPVKKYKADYFSAFSPELLYRPYIKLMEFPCLETNYRWEKQDKFTIVHIPSSPERKGSDIVKEAFKMINRNDVRMIYSTRITNLKAMDIKKTASIYIDQMLLPVYGNAAVEAMSMGIPVLNWDEGLYPYDTPVIKPKERTAKGIADALNEWLDWKRLEELSKKTIAYCQLRHCTVGKRWAEIYKTL